jgi:diguanylate cyclase (GGDEF)-like protein/PAS domain S-box-containing protein
MSANTLRALLLGGETHTISALQESLRDGITPQIQLTHSERLCTDCDLHNYDAIIVHLDLMNSLTPHERDVLLSAALRMPVLFLNRSGDRFTIGEVIPSNVHSWLVDEMGAAGPTVAHVLLQAVERAQLMKTPDQAEVSYRELFEQVPVGLYCTTPDGRLIDANPALVQMLGFPDRASLLAANVADLYADPADRQREFELLRRDGVVRGIELRLHRPDGAIIWVQDYVQAVHDQNGYVLYARGNLIDVTERKRTDEKLHYLSSHDVLTDLFNRAYFDEALARSGSGDQFPVSMVVVDVDRLKRTNDLLGHAAGDELLQRTAAVLRAALSDGMSVVARIGGDEFAALLPRANMNKALEAVRQLRRELALYNADHGDAPINLSIGVATATPDEDLEHVMLRADRCMYEDKQAHGPM